MKNENACFIVDSSRFTEKEIYCLERQFGSQLEWAEKGYFLVTAIFARPGEKKSEPLKVSTAFVDDDLERLVRKALDDYDWQLQKMK